MKINVDMDVTPEEMRHLLGLPDLTPLHEEMITRMKDQMSENMDPAKLVENYLQGSFSSMEAFQRTMSNFINSGNKNQDK